MNKEKLYTNVDYLFAWQNYEFHMKDGSVFVAYCEQDGGIRWKLRYYVDAGKRKYCPIRSIDIKNEDVEYILDLEKTELLINKIRRYELWRL